jgi:hypothetical protein
MKIGQTSIFFDLAFPKIVVTWIHTDELLIVMLLTPKYIKFILYVYVYDITINVIL